MIACGFDVHRAQITFDLVDHETGVCGRSSSRRPGARWWRPRWRRSISSTANWRCSIASCARTCERIRRREHSVRLYGVGDLTAVAIYAAVGDARRFSSVRKVIRLAGLDVTVHESDRKRQPGRLSRQGPPMLRWAAYEAGLAACRGGSPDHADYLALRERLGHKTACLIVSRRVLRRAYHALVAVGDATLEPLRD